MSVACGKIGKSGLPKFAGLAGTLNLFRSHPSPQVAGAELLMAVGLQIQKELHAVGDIMAKALVASHKPRLSLRPKISTPRRWNIGPLRSSAAFGNSCSTSLFFPHSSSAPSKPGYGIWTHGATNGERTWRLLRRLRAQAGGRLTVVLPRYRSIGRAEKEPGQWSRDPI